MKYYVVITRLEIPLVEPQPGETKAANIVNEGCANCLFDYQNKFIACKIHYKIKDLVLVLRKIDLPDGIDNVVEFVVPAEATVPVVPAAVSEPEAVPA